jgi:hypothetical protein
VDVETTIANLQALVDGKQAAAQPEVQEEAKAESQEPGGQQEQPVHADAPAEAQVNAPSESPEAEVPLTARQRAALFRQEQALQKQREAISQKEQELTSREKQLVDELLNSPSATLKKYGVENPADFATLLWHEALGERAPEAYKQQAQARILAGKAKQLEEMANPEKIKQTVQEAVQQAVVTTKIDAKEQEILSFVDSVPQDMKFLGRAVAKDKAAITQAFYDIAIEQFNRGNFSFSARDIAKAIDAEIENDFKTYQDLYPSGPSQSESTPAVEQRQTSKTLMAPETVEKPSKEISTPNGDPAFWQKRGEAVMQALLAKTRK